MKEKLMKLLKAKQERRSTLNKSMIDSDSKEERAAIGETLAKLGEEIAEVEAMLAELDKPAEGGEGGAGLLTTMLKRYDQLQNLLKFRARLTVLSNTTPTTEMNNWKQAGNSLKRI